MKFNNQKHTGSLLESLPRAIKWMARTATSIQIGGSVSVFVFEIKLNAFWNGKWLFSLLPLLSSSPQPTRALSLSLSLAIAFKSRFIIIPTNDCTYRDKLAVWIACRVHSFQVEHSLSIKWKLVSLNFMNFQSVMIFKKPESNAINVKQSWEIM